MQKATAVAKVFGRILLIPTAGAFGLWLLAESPAIHAAVCAARY